MKHVVVIGNGSQAHEFAQDVLGLCGERYAAVTHGDIGRLEQALGPAQLSKHVLVYYLWARLSPFKQLHQEMLELARIRSSYVIVVTEWVRGGG